MVSAPVPTPSEVLSLLHGQLMVKLMVKLIDLHSNGT